MTPATIPLQQKDLEFANPPISLDFIRKVFQKYDLRLISYFGNNMFYVAQTDGQPYQPLYPKGPYPEDIELLFDFMTIERIKQIECKEHILYRSPILEHTYI